MMKTALFAAALLGLSTTAAAQAGAKAGVSPECRAEVVRLCPKTDDRTARRQCMMANRDKVSQSCRDQIRAARAARRGGAGGATTPEPTEPMMPQGS